MKILHSYLVGFAASLVLTGMSFFVVYMHLQNEHVSPTHEAAAIALVVLAVSQFLVQVHFFLHVGQDSRRRWDLVLFIFALIVVGIVVGGTLWIMYHLSHLHSAPRELYTGGVVTPQTQND